MKDLIVDIINGLVKVIKTSREALAADLEKIAADLRSGKLIPDEAFKQAKETLDATQDARDKLPG